MLMSPNSYFQTFYRPSNLDLSDMQCPDNQSTVDYQTPSISLLIDPTTTSAEVTTANVQVRTTSDDVTTPADDVTTTSDDVTTPSKDVTTPSEDHTTDDVTTSEDVTTLSKGVPTTSDDITTTSEDVTTTSKNVTTTSEVLTTAADDLTTNPTLPNDVTTEYVDVTKQVHDVTTAAMDVTTLSDDVTTKSADITTVSVDTSSATDSVDVTTVCVNGYPVFTGITFGTNPPTTTKSTESSISANDINGSRPCTWVCRPRRHIDIEVLRVDKLKTVLSIRSRTSAIDNRISAICMGCVAILVLVTVFVMLVLADTLAPCKIMCRRQANSYSFS